MLIRTSILPNTLIAFLYAASHVFFEEKFALIATNEPCLISFKVLDKVFFVGAAPHYTEEVFDYIEGIFVNKWEN